MLQLQPPTVSGLQEFTLTSIITCQNGLSYAALTNNSKTVVVYKNKGFFFFFLAYTAQPLPVGWEPHSMTPHTEIQADKAAKCFRSLREREKKLLKVLQQQLNDPA